MILPLSLVFFCLLIPLSETSDVDSVCTLMEKASVEAHFSTKTPYRVVANLNEDPLKFPKCTPTRIWSVIRHGTRNPSRKDIRKAKKKLPKFQKKILENSSQVNFCPKELSKLKLWYFKADEEEEKFLVAEGEDELIELAERMQKRFPELLPVDYSSEHYLFKYTATQRTLKSAESFCTGLFGRHKLSEILYPDPLHKDPILRFYKLCNKWKEDVDKNPVATEEVEKFMESLTVKKLVEEIREITKITNLNAKDVHLMYKVCAFETAWSKNRKSSPWCSVFSQDSIKIIEFLEDLEYYWIDGYGYELTHKQACPAVKDLFEHIDPKSTFSNATFYFTHSGTMLKLLAHLGLYKDEFVLTHTDFDKERQWKTSYIDAFASNLQFILFECPDEPKVLVMHQERIVKIPGCPANAELCSLSTMKTIFNDSIENCNFNDICKNGNDN